MKTRNDELRERPQTTNQVDRDLRARSGLRFAYVCFALAAFFALCGILAANAATVTNRAVAYDAATGRITTPTNIWAVAGIDTNDDENIAAHSNLIVAAQADATAALDTNALLWANQSAHSNLIDNIEADATAISNLVVAAQADATAALDTNALLWANQSAHSNLIDNLEADATAVSNLAVAAQADATAALDTNALLWANQAAHSNLIDGIEADYVHEDHTGDVHITGSLGINTNTPAGALHILEDALLVGYGSGTHADGQGDVYAAGELEVDGPSYLDGGATVGGTFTCDPGQISSNELDWTSMPPGLQDGDDTNAQTRITAIDDVPEGWMGLDIGPESIRQYKEVISASRTILWNGPMGVFEMENFQAGTKAVAEAIVEATSKGAFSLVGGGDSVAAVNKYRSRTR